MRIEIWSDIVCPWCYIGKRRFEKAAAAWAGTDPRRELEVVWRSFQLDPGAPTDGSELSVDMLGRKLGIGREGARRMMDQVEATAAEEGLLYRLGQTPHVNTLDAHRLIHLAAEQGGRALAAELKEALLAAYFLQARNVADHEVLAEVATGTGLAATRVGEVLASTEFADAVHADIAQAQAYGATGVPFFVVDGTFGVSGAQPVATFAQVLDRAWAQARPQVQMVGEGEACGPDGCPI